MAIDNLSGPWTPNAVAAAINALNEGKQDAPTRLTSLPASGTALTADCEYVPSATVGTYTFAFPASGEVYVRFTTAATCAVTWASGTLYAGAVPVIEASKTYELLVRDRIVACAEVVSA